jgi:hypothetical protein
MNYLFYFVAILLLSGCASEKCLTSKKYGQFKNIIVTEKESILKSKEKEFKTELLKKSCHLLNETDKCLFIEEISNFGVTRRGLIFLYNKKQLFYFSKENKGSFVIGSGDNKYLPLRKVLDYVVEDFKNQTNKLKDCFDNLHMSDSPLLQVYSLDESSESITGFYEFTYSPNSILESNFCK